jgi:hypothetical protein
MTHSGQICVSSLQDSPTHERCSVTPARHEVVPEMAIISCSWPGCEALSHPLA